MKQQKSILDPAHIQVLRMIADGDLDLRAGNTYSSIISDLFNLGLLVGSRYAPETLQLTPEGEDALNSKSIQKASDLVGITPEMIDRLRAIGTYGSMGLDVNDPDDNVSALLIERGFVTPTGLFYPSDLGDYDVPIYRLSATGQQIIIDEASGGIFDKSIQKMPATGGYGMSGDYSELLDWVSRLPFTAGFIIFNANDDPEGYSKAEQAVAYGLLIRRDNMISDEPQFSETRAYSLSIQGAMAAAGKSVKEKQKSAGNIPNIKAWRSEQYKSALDDQVDMVIQQLGTEEQAAILLMYDNLAPIDVSSNFVLYENQARWLRLSIIEAIPENRAILTLFGIQIGKRLSGEKQQKSLSPDLVYLLNWIMEQHGEYELHPADPDYMKVLELERMGFITMTIGDSGYRVPTLSKAGYDALEANSGDIQPDNPYDAATRNQIAGKKQKSAPLPSSPALQFLEQQKQSIMTLQPDEFAFLKRVYEMGGEIYTDFGSEDQGAAILLERKGWIESVTQNEPEIMGGRLIWHYRLTSEAESELGQAID